jgi:hypothetical protein
MFFKILYQYFYLKFPHFFSVCLSVMHTEWLCKKCDSRDFSKIIEARETETNPINEKWYCRNKQEQARTKMKKLRWSREKKSEMKHGREIFFRISINWNEIRSNAVSLLLVLCGWKNLFIFIVIFILKCKKLFYAKHARSSYSLET